MTYSKANMRAVDKYVRNNYDSFLVRVPKGRKQTIEAFARAHGESVNGLVGRLLRDALGLSEVEWRATDSETEDT
ncbi:MAG: Arc family DNA-binding protein [Clostridia bacterium]|nr:Arc family DNA-binding protein [Clostridia bacterium]